MIRESGLFTHLQWDIRVGKQWVWDMAYRCVAQHIPIPAN